jgi:hypothetical protein
LASIRHYLYTLGLYERKESKQAVSQLSETNAKFTARDDNKKLHINSGKEATTVSGTVKLLLLIVDNSIGKFASGEVGEVMNRSSK